MSYGTSRAADRCTRTRPTTTQWQRERMGGVLLPMETPSLFQRMREKWGRR